MILNVRSVFLSCIALMSTIPCFAQRPIGSTTQPSSGQLALTVVVASKSEPAVSGLQRQDFTVLENGTPQDIASFRAVTGREAPVEVVLVIDAVNVSTTNFDYAREEIEKFLKSEGGALAHPMALAASTDKGLEILGQFSTDGNILSGQMRTDQIGLRILTRASGFYGAAERQQLSLKALSAIAESEAPRPGRKLVIWISSGWPLLSGARVELDSKQQAQVFADVVALSNVFIRANVTLYSIDPLGTADAGAYANYYEAFLKGVTKPSETDLGDLGLQVLATHSGGLALSSNNDVAGELRKCLADADSYYELTFASSPARQPYEYRKVEIKVSKPGLSARTVSGYYAQP